MYLKRLELLGFKSFPDKTVIKLTKGVTSIVGPNGCGKTNVLDSIRWVLGEQKVSLLRGTKMEEIIFNGTKDVKPLGMAEVTLVIQNNKGILPTEYGEVQISRRLFRSGESEYLLNKVPCRLKDISDLLMDTGIGAHVYSVIQQDMIDAILSDRADDRRFLFEEAAGISKYKNRKKVALRKLEATEQDLLRLKDIVSEVTTNVNSLNRQLKKAERYQKMADELKSWEIFLTKSSATALKTEQRELSSRKESMIDERAEFDAEIDTLSARQEAERKELTDLDRELTQISSEIYDKSEAAHSVEKEITILKEKRENYKHLAERNALDIEAFGKRKNILLGQIENLEKEMLGIDQRLSEIDTESNESDKAALDADNRVLEARRIREETAKKLGLLENQLSAGKSDDSNLREQESETRTALTAVESTLGGAAGNAEKLARKLEALQEQTNQIEEQIKERQSHRVELENEISMLISKSEELSGELFDLSASLEAAEATHHLLNDMITHHEGYGAGVVATFENRDRWPNLIGTVADCFMPRPGYEDAIEAALGDAAGFMICRDRGTAEDIINHLRSEKKGKAGLIILDESGPDGSSTRPVINDPNFIGWADEFVTIPDDLHPLLSLLLSRTALIDSTGCDSVRKLLPDYFTAVTTEGKFMHGRSIISGGSNEGLSLLGRKEKIREQEETIAGFSQKIEAVKQVRNDVTTRLATRQAEVRHIISEIDNLGDQSNKVDKDLTAVQFEMQSLENEVRRIEKERDSHHEKLELLKNRQLNLSLNYDQLSAERQALTQLLEEHDRSMRELESRTEEAQNQLSRLRINQVEMKSKRQQSESQIRHTRELIAEIESNSSQKTREINAAENEIAIGAERMSLLERHLKEIFDVRAAIADNQTAVRTSHASLQESLNSREKDIKTLRVSREESAGNLHAAELRMTEIESELKGAFEKIKNEYDLNLDDISAVSPNPEITPDAYRERMQELREAIRSFGAVNLLALEEYGPAKERQEFLTSQLTDLLSAKATLQTTIGKINVTARNLFVQTFAKVRENFQKVFAELFTGGEADIRLLDIEDPLESPIEIIARPRGKKLLSIAQMSGGERALTAISLLFAIYLVKPSPFCILDEIDAPLDDANIHRFLKMIKAFSDQTQFIIITHNKITMEAADVLYGITMEQPGISRVVSVRFNEEADEPLVSNSLDEIEVEDEIKLPDAVQERLSPKINIDSSGDMTSNN